MNGVKKSPVDRFLPLAVAAGAAFLLEAALLVPAMWRSCQALVMNFEMLFAQPSWGLRMLELSFSRVVQIAGAVTAAMGLFLKKDVLRNLGFAGEVFFALSSFLTLLLFSAEGGGWVELSSVFYHLLSALAWGLLILAAVRRAPGFVCGGMGLFMVRIMVQTMAMKAMVTADLLAPFAAYFLAAFYVLFTCAADRSETPDSL